MLIYKISDLIVFSALKNIKHGFLEIKKVNGEVLKFGNPDENLKVFLEIKDESLNYNLIKSGSIGLGESYMKDLFITNNLSDLIELTAKNIKTIYKFSGIFDLPFINFIKNKIIKNTKNRSKENIAKHYDLGNDFFSLWLDKTLTYSSAIFESPKQELFEAQNNKYQKLIDLIRPSSGNKILEIGCGWGGFAEYLGTNYDVKLDCITISKKQYEFAKERIHRCGLNEKVNIQIKDYRDLKDKYDHIASIEMIEAVGAEYVPGFFEKASSLLKTNGLMALQGITYNDPDFDAYKNSVDFIRKYIFPGSCLVAMPQILNAIKEKTDMVMVDSEDITQHYARTLEIWREDFQKVLPQIKELGFSEPFTRIWNFYLVYCEAGFLENLIGDFQFVFAKPDSKNIQITY